MRPPVARQGRGAVAVLLCALAVGCAHQSWNDPGNRWLTGRSEHFVIHGDGSRGSLESVLVRLEETYSALSLALFPNVEIPVIEGIVFSDGEEFEALSGDPRVIGLFVPGVGATGSMLVARGDIAPQYVDRTVAHELAHRFIHQSYPRLPVWLNEGLALYLSTVQVRNKGILFGAAPREELSVVTGGGAVPLAELMQARGSTMHGPEGHRYYPSAWAFMHQLIHSDAGIARGRLRTALAQLDGARTPADVTAALAAVYPERTLEDMEHAMFAEAAWMQSLGADHMIGMRVPRPEVHVATTPADRAQIGALCRQLMVRLHPDGRL